MRIALIGWESEDELADVLAQLGADVVVATRWFPGCDLREERGGWTKLRCPHQIGGSLQDEARSFREAVLHQLNAFSLGTDFDVVHALDAFAQPAAAGLRERSPAAALIGTVERLGEAESPDGDGHFQPDRWICEHPWLAERWGRCKPSVSRVEVIGRGREADAPRGDDRSVSPENGPHFIIWVPREASVDPAGIVSAVARVREDTPSLWVVVLGDGPTAQAARSRLAARGWLGRMQGDERTLEQWQFWVRHATVVGIASERPADDPAARIAWSAGVPVVNVGGNNPGYLANAIRDAMRHPGRRDRDVKVGAALARSAVEPASIARAWLAVYLDVLMQRSSVEPVPPPDEPAAFPLQPASSRLSVTALSPRELYASWRVRPGDWLTALEWLGEDATRATLALRLLDVSDIRFHGANAHGHRDVELGPDERHRVVGVDAPGRSFAASLGVLSRRGCFLTIAHARLCHLPREGLAPPGPPEQRIAVHAR